MELKDKMPFNRACVEGKDMTYIAEAIERMHISGDGTFTKRCQSFLQDRLGKGRVYLTTSCTDALEMSSILLDIKPGDEFIAPSFTFVTTINSFVLRGAKPVFVDIRPDTLNMDERLLERSITSRTKAIIPVHYAGVGCEMDSILDIAKRHGIPVVEDNAHGLLGKYRGEYLGTMGCLATQSFHETKNITCGEGGALIVNDGKLVERAEVIREKGTNRSRFLRGQVDKYSWVDVGSSFLPSDILAAFIFGQLEEIDRIQERRRCVWNYYDGIIQDWARRNGARTPFVPEHCEQSYHMYYLLMPPLDERQDLIGRLRSKNIFSVFHYLPLHLSEMGRSFGGKEGDCPVTEDICDRLVRLPFYNNLSKSEQDRIVDALE